MILNSISVKNYRSIQDLTISLEQLEDNSFSFGLIGVNEAGKSSILKAIATTNGLIPLTLKDFNNKNDQIVIDFNYTLSAKETDTYKNEMKIKSIEIDLPSTGTNQISISYLYERDDLKGECGLFYKTKNDIYSDMLPLGEELQKNLHKAIFWTSDEKYLISKPINLASFAAAPEQISVPLRNCFILAGIKNISERIKYLADDSTEIEELQTLLGNSVTQHIKSVWPNHPIEITFLISSGSINFHIRDSGIIKAKTADQRSDGFKRFVSFLLTISAQNVNEELSSTILLLDEPETHLHPKAQEYLMNEIIKITQNKRRNVALFATHSNYMIDKIYLNRNYRITKQNDSTNIEQLSNRNSTFASVNYQVFDICSTDYFNELYANLHEAFIEEGETEADKKERKILSTVFR